MNWNKGFTATYYAYEISPVTWRELGRVEMTGGSVCRESAGLRESADMECVRYETGKEKWVRIYLDIRQHGESAHIPLFTGLACTPSITVDGIYMTHTVQCSSVLKPAQDVLLDRGYYVPEGSNGAEIIRQLLSVTPAPVRIEGTSKDIAASIIAEEGETHLSMAEKVLAAIGWRLHIEGDGTVVLQPKAQQPSAAFDALSNDSIEPQITIERDWYECPNVFRAVQDEFSAVARDDDPSSPLSTVSRGREIWAEDTSCDFNTGESISEYAVRRLKELQTVRIKASYDRRFRPDIFPGDIVRLRYPAQGLDGLFLVDSQKIELGYGARTSEEVRST